MLKVGIDYQVFFCLEDFKNNKQGVNRNIGLFWFELDQVKYIGGPKSMFNVLRMLNMLGSEMFLASRLDNEFIGIIATKTKTGIALLMFNYIDPELVKNYISRNLAELHPKHARILANLINSDKWERILNKQIDLGSLRLHKRIITKIGKAIALNDKMGSLTSLPQNINLTLTNLDQDGYTYKKYIVDKICRLDCAFAASEKKEIKGITVYKETLSLEPYSVVLVMLDKMVASLEVSQETEQINTQQPLETIEKEDEQDQAQMQLSE
jgi:hypothetical protein